MDDAVTVQAFLQYVLAGFFKPDEPNRHSCHRLAGSLMNKIHEVVVLHLTQRDDFRGFIGRHKADPNAGAQGQGISGFKKDSARRNIAGNTWNFTEEDRFDPDGKDLVEPQMLSLVWRYGRNAWGTRG